MVFRTICLWRVFYGMVVGMCVGGASFQVYCFTRFHESIPIVARGGVGRNVRRIM